MSIETIGIIDLETQGLDPTKDLVVEAAFVWWSVRDRCVLSTWSELVQAPTNPAEHVNRIPLSALSYGLTFEHACEAIKSRAARADLLMAHRASFDFAFLPDLGKPIVCSKFDVPWPKSNPGDGLAYVAIAHDVPIVSAHRALADCLLLARCFERCAELADLEAPSQSVHDQAAKHGVEWMLAQAMLPRTRCVAMTTYAEREITKKAGFRWNGEMKSWWRDIVDEEIGKLPFQVRRVPAGSAEYVGLAKS